MTDDDLSKYCKKAIESGFTHAKQIHPHSVITAPWVRLKCQFGCPGFNSSYCCPPHTPAPEQTRAVLDCYNRAILFHLESPYEEDREKALSGSLSKLIELEGEIFKDGYYKVFLMTAGPCRECQECASLQGTPCMSAWTARPSMEGCGIDVYQTARDNGFQVRPLREMSETHNWFCLMLVD